MSRINKNEEDFFADIADSFSDINDDWFLNEHKNEPKINLDIEDEPIEELSKEGLKTEELPVEESPVEESSDEDLNDEDLNDEDFTVDDLEGELFDDELGDEDELLELLESLEDENEQKDDDDLSTDSLFDDDFDIFSDIEGDLEKELDDKNIEVALEADDSEFDDDLDDESDGDSDNDVDDEVEEDSDNDGLDDTDDDIDKAAKKSKNGPSKKKKGFLSKLFSKSDDDETDDTDENQKIIDEVEQSEKKKKEKKAKKQKKEKKAKKPKKQKKPKKIKEKKIEDINLEPSKPLPKLKVALTIILCVSFIVLFFLGTKFLGYFLEINSSKSYYAEGKYVDAYDQLSGVEIKDADKEYYKQVVVMGKLSHALEAGQSFIELNKYPEALDSLIKGLKVYNEDIETVGELGIEKAYSEIYDQIISILSSTFKLSKDEANSLVKIKDDYDYSIKIYEITDKIK